ncbi:hypothetical protein [Streptomyces sp. NPDC057889]|uniref:hypothetical protein n=1 Tax=unclassified Streptomyces TaxID=2593676 RepID=UPI0036B66481
MALPSFFSPPTPAATDALGASGDGGLDLDQIAAFCTLTSQQSGEHAELILAADWLADIAVDAGQGRLRGQLTECVLSLSGLM